SRMLRILVSSVLFVTLSRASFCGDSTIPYSLEVLQDCQPVLGCARLSCFGWTPDGRPASSTGSFFLINGQADGFLREGPDSIPPYGSEDARYDSPQTAICDHSFSSDNCAGSNQWVGGIAPLLNITSFPTTLQCCTLEALLQSEDRGVASLHDGHMVIGGEKRSEKGILYGFDYISDVTKILRPDGS
ncbi:hypothetical protein PENTCL1PPCAC_19341, partial [Pristionchus entomophagus]